VGLTKLEYAEEFIKAVVAQCIEGGSFRYFIYDRLGFGPEAYSSLYMAGGMAFTNATPVNMNTETVPYVPHVGIALAARSSVAPDPVEICWDDGKIEKVQRWPGSNETYGINEPVLYIYFSDSHSGMTYILPAGEKFSAYKLAEAGADSGI